MIRVCLDSEVKRPPRMIEERYRSQVLRAASKRICLWQPRLLWFDKPSQTRMRSMHLDLRGVGVLPQSYHFAGGICKPLLLRGFFPYECSG